MNSSQQRCRTGGNFATAAGDRYAAVWTKAVWAGGLPWGGVVAVLVGIWLGWVEARAEVQLPPVRVVMDRMVERSAEWTRNDARYSYQKRSVQEELDADGNPIGSVEKLYHVDLIQGIPFPRLVQIEGRDLTQQEIRAENERERAFRNRVTGTDPVGMVERREPLVTRELLSRYRFTLEGVGEWNERPVWVLAFTPRTSRGAMRTIQDRILGRLTGRIWVDTEDAEVARLEVVLTESFSLGWLGWMGSLQECELHLERRRMPDGVWVPSRQSLLLVGRRLMTPLRYRTTEESYGYVPR
jgi:hypothetical protein